MATNPFRVNKAKAASMAAQRPVPRNVVVTDGQVAAPVAGDAPVLQWMIPMDVEHPILALVAKADAPIRLAYSTEVGEVKARVEFALTDTLTEMPIPSAIPKGTLIDLFLVEGVCAVLYAALLDRG